MATYNQPQFISDRVPVTPPLSADPVRYQFLNVKNAEPNLGVPLSATTGANYLAYSNAVGTRGFTSNSSLVLSGNNVGIGIIPSFPLDVQGDINITGEYRKNGEIVSVSGYSGYSGYSGASGYSGESGYSGISGYSGTAGTTGGSGFSGYSGYSGYTGIDGPSGYSGYSGLSGY
jgi:hypothetical protein